MIEIPQSSNNSTLKALVPLIDMINFVSSVNESGSIISPSESSEGIFSFSLDTGVDKGKQVSLTFILDPGFKNDLGWVFI
jgi:hypothetical protein